MKKLLSLSLAVIMILSLMTGISFAEEKRVLTIASMVDYSDDFATEIFRELEEKLGCEIRFTHYDTDSFAALMSSGDMADIMMPKAMIINVLEGDLAMNIDPYIDEYAPNLRSEYCAQTMELSRKLMSKDGGLYIIPPCIGIHNYIPGGVNQETRGYVVRWDYYKELGCPEIHNDDDYIAVLQQMLAAHPTTEDGSRSLLYGVEKSFGDLGGYRSAFKSDISVNTWCQYQYKSDIFTNEVYDGYLDVDHSRYWSEMVFMNKIYRLGLFDEDCFIMSADEYNAKCDKGQYMGLYYRSARLYTTESKKDPNTDKGYVVIPSDGMNNYFNINMIMGNCPSYYSFISKNAKNYDLALQLYNYMYDIDYNRYMYSGKQGETWDYDENGVPYMFDEALAAMSAGDPYWISGAGNGGHGVRHYGFIGYNPGMTGSDGYPLKLSLSHEAATASQSGLMKDFANTYGFEYWADAFVGVEKDFRNDAGEAISACVTNISMDDLRIIESCNTVLESNIAALVMAESDEEFEAIKADMLDEMKGYGEEEVFVRYQAEWNAVKDIIVPLMRESAEAIGIELYPVD